jgi:hypothetical protein
LSRLYFIEFALCKVIAGKTETKKRTKTTTNAHLAKGKALYVKVGPLIAIIFAARQDPPKAVNARRQRLESVAITKLNSQERL